MSTASPQPIFRPCHPRKNVIVVPPIRDWTAAAFEARVKLIAESIARAACGKSSAYCLGTPLRDEIVTKDAASAAIAARHGRGQIAGKIQAHIITGLPGSSAIECRKASRETASVRGRTWEALANYGLEADWERASHRAASPEC